MADTVSMPKLGFDMAEGTLVRWVKAEGEAIAKGDVLAEIETDKATVEVESTFEGTVLKHLVEKGTSVPVGSPIAVIGQPGEEVNAEAAAPAPAASAPAKDGADEKQAEAPAPAAQPDQAGQTTPAGEVKASPLARRMAAEHNIDLGRLTGTGPGGRVVKKDIEAALEGGAPAAAPAQATPRTTPATQTPVPTAAKAAPEQPVTRMVDVPLSGFATGQTPADERVELNRLRSAIGRRMVESKQQVPHFYVTHEYDVDELMALRKQVNDLLPDGQKLSINDFIIKAVALCLRRYPNLNASLEGDQIIRHGAVNIGNAVAVPGGLLTVVVKGADQKPLRLIAQEMKEMAGRVREGKVKPDDIEGSTFSISNLGMFDVLEFLAIINPPEAAILAVSTAQQMPVVVDGEVKVRWRVRITLSADHRITDGAEAAEFMQALEDYIEKPMRLMM